MTQPQKLSDLLAQTTAQRHREEHNAREAERLDAYKEFAEDDDSRELVGDVMAERLLTHAKPVWAQTPSLADGLEFDD